MKKLVMMALLGLSSASAQMSAKISDARIPFPSPISEADRGFEMVDMGKAFVESVFRGIQGEDYFAFSAPSQLTDGIIVSQCLRIAQMLYVRPDTFRYEKPTLGKYTNGFYIVVGDGLVNPMNGQEGLAQYTCLAKKIGNTVFFQAATR